MKLDIDKVTKIIRRLALISLKAAREHEKKNNSVIDILCEQGFLKDYFTYKSILKLIKELSFEDDSNQWVDVKDRLPEYTTHGCGEEFIHVLVCLNGNLVTEGMYCNGVWEALNAKDVPVTHWRLMPEPPKEFK